MINLAHWSRARVGGPPLEGREPEFELVDSGAQDLDLLGVDVTSLRAAAQARRCFDACGNGGEGHQALLAVGPVDEPRRDLPGAVPAPQRGPRYRGFGRRALEGDPIGALELSV